MIDSQLIKNIKYNSDGLVPAIVQDAHNGEVLMMAWMNEESLKITLESGKATYYSRSRQCLWIKGETSGHFQDVKEISIDCDADTILIKAIQHGSACHTMNRSCFYRKIYEEN